MKRTFERCPKCGEDDPRVAFIRPSARWIYCEQDCPDGEHFNLECRRCGYRWYAVVEAG